MHRCGVCDYRRDLFGEFTAWRWTHGTISCDGQVITSTANDFELLAPGENKAPAGVARITRATRCGSWSNTQPAVFQADKTVVPKTLTSAPLKSDGPPLERWDRAMRIFLSAGTKGFFFCCGIFPVVTGTRRWTRLATTKNSRRKVCLLFSWSHPMSGIPFSVFLITWPTPQTDEQAPRPATSTWNVRSRNFRDDSLSWNKQFNWKQKFKNVCVSSTLSWNAVFFH